MKMNTTKEYLDYYKTIQDIEVVYHPHERISWGRNRKIYDGDFDCDYNHRSILVDEVVFDFDNEEQETNQTNSKKVSDVFKSMEINHSLWSTGNKGYHIHTLWKDLGKLSNPSLMKKVILKSFALGMSIDYQLAGKHLVRAEYGVHEKNLISNKGKEKILDYQGLEYNTIPKFIISEYKDALIEDSVKKIVKCNSSEVNDETLRKVLDNEIKVNDGREKIMFFAIHQLKKKYNYDEVVNILVSWYRYSGGSKLSKIDIKNKVKYHWNRDYSFKSNYLDDYVKV